jgi:hypothetical protein
MLYGQWRENMDNHEQPEQQSKYKISDGRMMQGICIQWFQDTYPDASLEELAIYVKIARHTIGFRKRDGYIEQSTFNLNPKTLKKYRDMLTNLGVIAWQSTKKFTLYKLLEPHVELDKFKLIQDRSMINIQPTQSSGSKDIVQKYNPDQDI